MRLVVYNTVVIGDSITGEQDHFLWVAALQRGTDVLEDPSHD